MTASTAVDLAAPAGGGGAPRRTPPGTLRTRAGALAGGSAPLLVVALAVSMHLGSAIATGLFDEVGPLGVLWLRCALAALLLVAIFRRRALALPRASRSGVLALGVVLAAMNACFFEAIARIPLGVASTIEFIGPLLVAVAGSRRLDLGCALLAGAGVALLGSPSADIDAIGALFAFGSAACWATYILLAKRLVGGAEPLPVLTFTLIVAAVVLAAPALSAPDAASLWDGPVLATGLAVAALASAIPYLLELLALRRVSAATFSVLLSLEPAIAALIGLAVLGQALGPAEIVAIGCVVVASAAAARATA